MSSDMSKNDTLRANPPSSSSTTHRVPITTPSSSRIRQPVPPSPLSRIEGGGSLPPPLARTKSNQAFTTGSAESSACFIHSHLDQHGSLQDRLKHNGSGSNGSSASPSSAAKPTFGHSHASPRIAHLHNGPSPVMQGVSHHSSPRPLPPQIRSQSQSPLPSSNADSRMTSPTGMPRTFEKGSPPKNGYESDRSSPAGGSAILDGDLIDEDEERGSLTRQLAETAQGVREMSRQLGRTRVRSRIQHVLIVTKARDNRLIKLTRELALYLMLKKPASSPETPVRPNGGARGMVVYVDAQLRTSKRFDTAGLQNEYPQLFEPIGRRRSSSSTSVGTLSAYPSTASLGEAGKRRDEGQLRYWTSEMCSNSPQLFDFVVTLGGDGTVLFTSWLFQRIVPPVLPFALGSLGFLTNFDYSGYKQTMDKVIDEGIRVNLRMRFTCTVYRAIAPEEAEMANAKGKGRKAIKKAGGEILMSQVDRGGWDALEGPAGLKDGSGCIEGKDKEIMCFSTRPVEQFEVLNDLVVDRGPSPFVSLLELFGDEHHLTTVQADGLTVSTPTGSTAYSLSAGGSLVHPQIPAILITPICPHTLSFRPMLLPDGMELRICVPYNSRSTAWASFDGRGRVELKQGDHIKVTASKYPFPTVCADKASTDWFSSISRTLRWNEREKQKSFVVVEEDKEPPKTRPASNSKRERENFQEAKHRAEENSKDLTVEDLHEESSDAVEEEDDFDIDDKSGGEATHPSSPLAEPSGAGIPPNALLSRLDHHKQRSGVDSPDRFATPYEGPPPLSQRHLIEALAAAELQDKEGEIGQRDEIRSGPEGLRIDGAHLIPPGRSSINPPPAAHGQSSATTRPHPPHQAEARRPRRKREDSKTKAFAFFGQDDSGSDMSDDQY